MQEERLAIVEKAARDLLKSILTIDLSGKKASIADRIKI